MQLMHHITPEGPYYRLKAVKDGHRVEKLDYGGLLSHEEPVKFPHILRVVGEALVTKR